MWDLQNIGGDTWLFNRQTGQVYKYKIDVFVEAEKGTINGNQA